MFEFKEKRINGYKVFDVCYHRNGIMGKAFICGKFQETSGDKQTYIFTVFANDDNEFVHNTNVRCSVLCLDYITSGENLLNNSWRGDYFYDHVVKDAIKEYYIQRG